MKTGVTVLVSSPKDNKGKILPSNNHFAQRDWGGFQDQHPSSQYDLLQILLKPFGVEKGPLLPSLGHCWKSPPPLMFQCYAQQMMHSAKQ